MSAGKELLKAIIDISCGYGVAGKVIGKSLYYNLPNTKNIAKFVVGDYEVSAKILSRSSGQVDSCSLSYSEYFAMKKRKDGSPLFTPHIDCDEWYFGSKYDYCRPTHEDFENLVLGMLEYMKLWDDCEPIPTADYQLS